ncbi:MAG: adenylyltransferase/cytidyltransferase family protein [Nanoarchaeota archaeon]
MRLDKIKTQEELAEIVRILKDRGKTIVTTNGIFDLIHIGHIRSYEDAKKFGDILVVGINSDSSVRYIRGDKRPLVPQKERAGLLAALDIVDYVTIFEETEPSKFLDRIKPSIHVKGRDWENKYCPEKELIERNGGKMKFIDLVQGFSTTNLIKKIVEAYGNEK